MHSRSVLRSHFALNHGLIVDCYTLTQRPVVVGIPSKVQLSLAFRKVQVTGVISNPIFIGISKVQLSLVFVRNPIVVDFL